MTKQRERGWQTRLGIAHCNFDAEKKNSTQSVHRLIIQCTLECAWVDSCSTLPSIRVNRFLQTDDLDAFFAIRLAPLVPVNEVNSEKE